MLSRTWKLTRKNPQLLVGDVYLVLVLKSLPWSQRRFVVLLIASGTRVKLSKLNLMIFTRIVFIRRRWMAILVYKKPASMKGELASAKYKRLSLEKSHYSAPLVV